MTRSPSLVYIAPFCAFWCLLLLSRVAPFPAIAVQAGFVAVMLAVLGWCAWAAARPASGAGAPAFPISKSDLGIHHWAGTLLVGVGVCAVWVLPDRLFPGYRHFWLFENPVMGRLETSLSAAARAQTAVLWLRGFRAVVIVPVVEELFWRAWLMRWLIAADFESVPLGTWSPQAFWIVALLFASEHGPYWDVGLAAGLLYNWWMVRTRSLGDLIFAHALTNACLSAYVVWSGRWEYWL